MLWLGTSQMLVPVNPWWLNTAALSAVLLTAQQSPRPGEDSSSDIREVARRMGAAPEAVEPVSMKLQKSARSRAVEKAPAWPDTPFITWAFSSWTVPCTVVPSTRASVGAMRSLSRGNGLKNVSCMPRGSQISLLTYSSSRHPATASTRAPSRMNPRFE